MAKIFRWLLWPLGLLYGLVQEGRNFLFKIGILKSVEFDIPVVSVGNLAVGGSGKTPMVQFLIEALSPTYTIAVLSRGYGRKTSGFKLVDENATAREVGDEPLEIKTAFPSTVVCVAEDRVLGVAELLQQHPEVNLILLDDAYQHQYIKPKVSLLLSRYNRPFYEDYVLPMGRLREFRKNVNRADAVIFTRGSDSPLSHELLKNVPVFYCKDLVAPPALAYGDGPPSDQVMVIAALADNEAFVAHVSDSFHIDTAKTYRDHYAYTASDIQSWPTQSGDGLPISWITTQKDWVKLKPLLEKHKPAVNIFVILVTPMFRDTTFVDWLTDQING